MLKKSTKIKIYVVVTLMFCISFMEGAFAGGGVFSDIKNEMIGKQVTDILGQPNDSEMIVGKFPFYAVLCFIAWFTVKTEPNIKIFYYKNKGRVYLKNKETALLNYTQRHMPESVINGGDVVESYRVFKIEEDTSEDGYR